MAKTEASLLQFWRDHPTVTKFALILFIVGMGLMLLLMLFGIGTVVYDMATKP